MYYLYLFIEFRTLNFIVLFNRFSDVDTAWMCNQNAAVAAQFGRKDLTYIWSLGALLATPTLTVENNTHQDLETPWAQNPFGRKLLHSMYILITSFL